MTRPKRSKALRAGAIKGNRAMPKRRRRLSRKAEKSISTQVPLELFKIAVAAAIREFEELQELEELSEEQLLQLQKMLIMYSQFIEMANQLLEAIQRALESMIIKQRKSKAT